MFSASAGVQKMPCISMKETFRFAKTSYALRMLKHRFHQRAYGLLRTIKSSCIGILEIFMRAMCTMVGCAQCTIDDAIWGITLFLGASLLQLRGNFSRADFFSLDKICTENYLFLIIFKTVCHIFFQHYLTTCVQYKSCTTNCLLSAG